MLHRLILSASNRSNFCFRIENIYTNMSEIYASADSDADLEFFRDNFGPNMPFIDISFVVSIDIINLDVL